MSFDLEKFLRSSLIKILMVFKFWKVIKGYMIEIS